MLLFQLISLFAFFGFVFTFAGASYFQLIDLPSLAALLLICIPTIIASGHLKNIFLAFSIIKNKELKYTLENLKNAGDALRLLMIIPVICAFCITTIGCIGIICNLEDKASLASALLLSFVPLFYSAINILIVIPFYSRIIILQNKAFGLEY